MLCETRLSLPEKLNRAQRKYLKRKQRQASKKSKQTKRLEERAVDSDDSETDPKSGRVDGERHAGEEGLSREEGKLEDGTKNDVDMCVGNSVHENLAEKEKSEQIRKCGEGGKGLDSEGATNVENGAVQRLELNKEEVTQNREVQTVSEEGSTKGDDASSSVEIDVEYVAADPVLSLSADTPNYEEFLAIFGSFKANAARALDYYSNHTPQPSSEPAAATASAESESKPDAGEKEASEQTEAPLAEPKLSRRQRRLARRLNIATIKQMVSRPDLVEIHDTTSADPFLLIHLKSTRGTVPVPRHWLQKRKYLQGKRGIEKIPFQLPDFVRNTGISDLRQAALDRAEKQKLKAKQRERLRPRMGQLDIDYNVLYEAFFRYQTKPNLTRHGELYYENKEFELKNHNFVAGQLSDQLKRALGMTDITPPPWLIKMQRIGPPPSYPNLRIPGLNAPIPPGAQYGFHAGGWGSAPIDMYGRPIWGWVENKKHVECEIVNGKQIPIDKNEVWGALKYEEDYEDNTDEEPSASRNKKQAPVSAHPAEGLDPSKANVPLKPGEWTSDGQTDYGKNNLAPAQPGYPLTSGLDTPLPASSEIDLRKFKKQTVPLQNNQQLYQVLPQQPTTVGQNLMGSQYIYQIPRPQDKNTSSNIDITLDPSDLELSEQELINKYQKLFSEQNSSNNQPQIQSEKE
ncbi:splicing factor 3B subunit 2-like [Schistocerca gregaria]|uniref:splicing factor 3B subunit 2-like n=1 Tax=Schistocerca gregaria TaxID=7010 RepID=UPI00211E288A|nr:splicing factor 3B subunit 2-like [Schistocerca gregaria]